MNQLVAVWLADCKYQQASCVHDLVECAGTVPTDQKDMAELLSRAGIEQWDRLS